jgi:hypothetical protein
VASSTAKRVLVYRFDRQPAQGVAIPGAYLRQDHIELISSSGTLQQLTYSEVKALCFVSDPGPADLFTDHNLFERRPKIPGLWTRFVLRDQDRLDGVLAGNLLDWPANGFLITPPRAGANRQRVFLPRAALASTELMGVVGVGLPSTGRRKRRIPEPPDQLRIFDR